MTAKYRAGVGLENLYRANARTTAPVVVHTHMPCVNPFFDQEA